MSQVSSRINEDRVILPTIRFLSLPRHATLSTCKVPPPPSRAPYIFGVTAGFVKRVQLTACFWYRSLDVISSIIVFLAWLIFWRCDHVRPAVAFKVPAHSFLPNFRAENPSLLNCSRFCIMRLTHMLVFCRWISAMKLCQLPVKWWSSTLNWCYGKLSMDLFIKVGLFLFRWSYSTPV